MKVKTLIEKLEKNGSGSRGTLTRQIRRTGAVCTLCEEIPGCLASDRRGFDMSDEIQARFDDAIENGTDELDVYMEMLETGIDVPMVRKHLGDEAADHMQDFCEEHGLI